MQRLRFPSFLFLPLLCPAIIVSAQSIPSAANDQPSPQASSNQSKHSQLPAQPIPANAPRLSRQTRLEIIRDFETQIFYARTVFPMGAKGLKLKDGTTSPNGPELQQ